MNEGEGEPMSQPVPQPYLHDLVSCLAAPAVALSGQDGQIHADGVQGMFRYDRRVLSELVVTVDGHEPTAIGRALVGARQARFTGLVRHVGDHSADNTVRLERVRTVRPNGVDEHLALISAARTPVAVTVQVRAAVDLAGVVDVKSGGRPPALSPTTTGTSSLTWADEHTAVTLRASQQPTVASTTFAWQVNLAARSRWEADLTLDVSDSDLPPNAFLPAADGAGWSSVTVEGPPELVKASRQGIADVEALMLADPLAPGDVFVAGGSPWFFTLFGRDSIWASRLTLPLGTRLAAGTLRTLARRQGTKHDSQTAEAPGKILHEVRTRYAHTGLPLVYFGTVDATALWVCLLHDAWRWGMPPTEVSALLDHLEGALSWLMGDADSDGDGFIEYVDLSGTGLANQGWKDSGDSIQFPDGRIAEPPIALSEAQAYAHEAAVKGAQLLAEFGRPGATEARDWAAALEDRFRQAFWVADTRGRFPAIALDGTKTPVDTATSNPGHLLGTGLLDHAEAALVAARLGQPDLDSGYGLRTMSADAAGFNPLGYHSGSIWPHDTVIAIRGLVADGQPEVAASLARGLLRASPDFDYRLPELFAGTDFHAGDPVVVYPASCRPQAWSAGVPIALLTAALGLTADAPKGIVSANPNDAFASWFPLMASGLKVAEQPLSVSVDVDGRPVVTSPLIR